MKVKYLKEIEIKTNEYTLEIKDNKANFTESNTGIKYEINYEELNTGILIYDLSHFDGYRFLDKEKNFYDTIKKNIFFNDNYVFLGDQDKSAFSLFENFDLIENKIKNAVDRMKLKSKDEDKKQIATEVYKELKKEIEQFSFDKIKLKHGKYGKTKLEEGKDIIFINDTYWYFHEDKLEEFSNTTKTYEGRYLQEIENNSLSIYKHGIGKNYVDNYEGEYFYDYKIGRGWLSNEKNEKFYFFENGMEEELSENPKEKDNEIYYTVGDERISLEMDKIKKMDNYVRIFIKDIKNEKNLYEINAKMRSTKKLKGTGFVHDFRKREILIVNFDTNNIISNNLDDLNQFIDSEELIINQKYKKKVDPESLIIDLIDSILTNENNIEYLATKINEKIVEEKLTILGKRNQLFSGECWVYALSSSIFMANARKYGRNLQNFEEIYNNIIGTYSKEGKTDEEIEKIMDQEFKENKYDLIYEKITNENKIDENKMKEFLKSGIQFYFTFNLNNKEWDNFDDYFEDKSIKQELKVLTKEILQRPNKKEVKDPDKVIGHAVILTDIDEEDNYVILNSWGESWGNKGCFKAKKDCFETFSIYAIYFTVELLKEEEKEAWQKFKISIKEKLLEMRKKINNKYSIRCPKCNKSAPISGYEGTLLNYFICPFSKRCIFSIENNYSFIAELLFDNDKNKAKKNKNKFDFGKNKNN